jgi:hypothetical protein
MRENHGFELQAIYNIPTSQQLPAAIVPLSPFALCIPTSNPIPSFLTNPSYLLDPNPFYPLSQDTS